MHVLSTVVVVAIAPVALARRIVAMGIHTHGEGIVFIRYVLYLYIYARYLFACAPGARALGAHVRAYILMKKV